MTEKTWLTLTEVALRISISKRTLQDAIHATDPRIHLPAVLNGNRWLVRTTDADAYPERAFPAG